MIVVPNHQAARENTDAAFENAHVYVHFKAVYILALKERGGKGDDGRVDTTQKFLHIRDVRASRLGCRALQTGS